MPGTLTHGRLHNKYDFCSSWKAQNRLHRRLTGDSDKTKHRLIHVLIFCSQSTHSQWGKPDACPTRRTLTQPAKPAVLPDFRVLSQSPRCFQATFESNLRSQILNEFKNPIRTDP